MSYQFFETFLVVLVACLLANYLSNAGQQTSKKNNQSSDTIPNTLPRKVFNLDEECHLVLLDDNISTIESVIDSLMKIFKFSQEEAVIITLRVHYESQALIWSGDQRVAEYFATKLKEKGMSAKIAFFKETEQVDQE